MRSSRVTACRGRLYGESTGKDLAGWLVIGPTNRWGLDVGAHLFQVRQMTHLLVVSDKRSTNGQIPSVAATVSGLFQCWPSGHPSFNLGIFRPSLSQAYIRSRCSWPQVAPRFDRKVRNFRSFPCGDRRLTFDMKAGKARLGSADHSFGSTGPELSTGANDSLYEPLGRGHIRATDVSLIEAGGQSPTDPRPGSTVGSRAVST